MVKIAVVGSINNDITVKVPHLPERGETIPGSQILFCPGGKGANQAVAAARYGADVSMVGRVGDDPYGIQLKNGLKNDGIDVSYLEIDPELPTGTALITVDDSGMNTIVVYRGSNDGLTPEHVEAAKNLLAESDLIVLQMEIPVETIEYTLKLSREIGVGVILNTAPAGQINKDAFACAKVIVANEVEACELTGIRVSDKSSAFKACEAFINMGPEIAIVTMGAEGAVGVNQESQHFVSAYKIDAVDSTAAGDAFVGVLAASLAEGITLSDAMRLGAAAGGLAASRMGAQASMATREEILKLCQDRR